MICATVFAFSHAVLFLLFPYPDYRTDIVPVWFMLWLLVDFPISLLVCGMKTPLLIAGSLQWGLWGYLICILVQRDWTHPAGRNDVPSAEHRPRLLQKKGMTD
jgi:hypothetical protein